MNAAALVMDGDASQEILRVAKDTDADLIVMDIGKKNIAERAFLGATAERVVRSAHVPVLSVPHRIGAIRDESGKEGLVELARFAGSWQL